MTAAERIIQKCGGVSRTAELAQTTENWVYRWTYPRERGGTGGEIPRSAQKALLQAAAKNLAPITAADFFDAARDGDAA